MLGKKTHLMHSPSTFEHVMTITDNNLWAKPVFLVYTSTVVNVLPFSPLNFAFLEPNSWHLLAQMESSMTRYYASYETEWKRDVARQSM